MPAWGNTDICKLQDPGHAEQEEWLSESVLIQRRATGLFPTTRSSAAAERRAQAGSASRGLTRQ